MNACRKPVHSELRRHGCRLRFVNGPAVTSDDGPSWRLAAIVLLCEYLKLCQAVRSPSNCHRLCPKAARRDRYAVSTGYSILLTQPEDALLDDVELCGLFQKALDLFVGQNDHFEEVDKFWTFKSTLERKYFSDSLNWGRGCRREMRH